MTSIQRLWNKVFALMALSGFALAGWGLIGGWWVGPSAEALVSGEEK